LIYNIHTIWIDEKFQEMCKTPYWGHPRGCPNYGKRKTCPPQQKMFFDVFDKDFYLIYTKFDLRSHIEKMKQRHPKWTNRQLKCCLYWQGTARKNLKNEIKRFKQIFPNHFVTICPEAMGVNVTDLMKKNAGIDLQWPIETVTYQVAIGGLKNV